MDYMELLSVFFRWLHVAAGILWIGLLYWFNFVNIPFVGTMDGDTMGHGTSTRYRSSPRLGMEEDI